MQKRYNAMYHLHDSGSAWLVWQCKLCYWLIEDTSRLCEKAIRLVNNGSLYQKLRAKKEWERSWLNASWMDALWLHLEWEPSNGTFLLVFSAWEKQPLLAHHPHQPLNARGMDTLPAEMMTLALEQTHNPLDPQSNTLSWTRCFGKAGVWWSGKKGNDRMGMENLFSLLLCQRLGQCQPFAFLHENKILVYQILMLLCF